VRALAAVGAIAVVVGGGYLLSQNSPSTTSGTSSRAAPLVRPGASGQHFGVNQQGGRMQTTGLPITFRDGRASVVTVASGINYRPATLAQQVTTALSAVPSAHAQVPLHPAPTAVSSPGSGTSAGPAATKFGTMTVGELRGCVGRIAPRGRVLLVDVARYQGRQATVIVVAPHGAARQVWVVGPACSASRGDVLAHLSMPGG